MTKRVCSLVQGPTTKTVTQQTVSPQVSKTAGEPRSPRLCSSTAAPEQSIGRRRSATRSTDSPHDNTVALRLDADPAGCARSRYPGTAILSIVERTRTKSTRVKNRRCAGTQSSPQPLPVRRRRGWSVPDEKFPSMTAFRAWYESREYQEILPVRLKRHEVRLSLQRDSRTLDGT
jgi:hypothetical protein